MLWNNSKCCGITVSVVESCDVRAVLHVVSVVVCVQFYGYCDVGTPLP